MINKFDGKYGFLSNFHPCEIVYQGITYPSVEHYYVAMKCNNDQMIDGVYYTRADFREAVARVSTAGKAKILGRKIKLRSDWDEVRLQVMEWGLNQKFRIEELQELLLATGDEKLVEGNWWHDNFFGSCTCPKCGDKGNNHLGKLLMKIRSEIRGSKKKGLEQLFK